MSLLKNPFVRVVAILSGCCASVGLIALVIFFAGTSETLKDFIEISTWVSLLLSLLGGMIVYGGFKGRTAVSHSIEIAMDEGVREELRKSRSRGDKLGLAIALSFGAVSFVSYRIFQSISG